MRGVIGVLAILWGAAMFIGGVWSLWEAFQVDPVNYARACFGLLVMLPVTLTIHRGEIISEIKGRRR